LEAEDPELSGLLSEVAWPKAGLARSTTTVSAARNRLILASHAYRDPNQNAPKDDHCDSSPPWTAPGMTPEGITSNKKHHYGDAVGNAERELGTAREQEGNHHWKGRQKNK
jgi:hypothetical protein